MNETMKRMLEEEYRKTLEEVSQATAGSDEAKWRLQKLTELHKQMMEEIQIENKCYVETQKLSLDTQEAAMKEEQAKENRVFTIIKVVIDGIAIVLPIWASWTWMARGLQFEKTGTFTSRTGNWMSNHLRLFKK